MALRGPTSTRRGYKEKYQAPSDVVAEVEDVKEEVVPPKNKKTKKKKGFLR